MGINSVTVCIAFESYLEYSKVSEMLAIKIRVYTDTNTCVHPYTCQLCNTYIESSKYL